MQRNRYKTILRCYSLEFTITYSLYGMLSDQCLQYVVNVIYSVRTTNVMGCESVLDHTETLDIHSEICPLLVSLFQIFNYKYNATVCSFCISKSVKSKCFHLHVKAKDRNLRDHFIHLYSNSS